MFSSKSFYNELGDTPPINDSSFYYQNGKEIPKTTQLIAFIALISFFTSTLIIGFTTVTFIFPFISEMKYSKESTCKVLKNRQNCFYNHQNSLICQYILQLRIEPSQSLITTLDYRFCPSSFAFCKHLEDGERTKCWYNPKNLGEVTVFKTPFSYVLIGCTFGIFIGVFSIVMTLVFFFKRMFE